MRSALLVSVLAGTAAAQNALFTASQHQPFAYGVQASYGNGITDNRDGFHFASAGVHASRVLTNNYDGHGPFGLNFEYGVEVLPYWQSFTPKFQRVSIAPIAGSSAVSVSQPYTVGGTFTGASITPIILRVNVVTADKLTYWIQGAGGVLWTNHKYPSYGDTTLNYNTNGPNGETSVWNFTPQGGVGVHYFTRPDRSIDFAVNAEHISSASLGDRNPGVNASIHVAIGYSWWK